jgi:hypothetical protein
MDGVSDTKVFEMNRPKSLSDILNMPGGTPAAPVNKAEKPAPVPDADLDYPLPPLDQLTPLPLPGDPYKAHSIVANGPLATVHMVLGDATVRGFSYGNFDSIDLLPADDAGGGPVIVVRFAGLSPCEVWISGRNLELMHNHLSHYRIAWIRELPTRGNFADRNAPLIRSIGFTPLE